ncbi:hypothetical protein Poli38472_014807 [Pythium oligandrum]|uniref:Uncharacterized protein n=1 Tax=Pythium oligandrum TaxID=41045 RepID=A0A8K1CKG5_PYTOL|nr:hypothetical protein Poli38472_014807 [Pythium oligandrum]|eukprot:TMW63897.1 hypothetical protein Poli38472_014807 [Pythium oligandrum]
MEPIAKRLKQSAESALSAATRKKQKEEEDLAERIKRLEAELQQSGASDDEDESDAESSSSSDDEDTDDKGAVVNLSAYADERVEALPEHLLPKASASSTNLPEKKRKRPAAGSDLLDVVQWPKKVPFACKPCGFVGKNLEDFQAHRQSAEHAAKQQVAPAVLTCKLCDKSFTSPHQLEEHKAGKWHQQRAKQRKARHVVKVCYDFMRGNCRHGDQCAFEHTETKAMKRGTALDRTKKRVCDLFERTGKCKFGDRCLFSHNS